jgi:glutamyl-tRNA synthetase
MDLRRADGRYAPSPSGPLHLGNLRTALLAWCFARSQGARFLLRIEDLDHQRSRREHEAAIVADLAALGLDWDEPPSRQSERLARHRAAFEELRRGGHLYPCWCTRAEVRAAAAAPHPPLRAGGPAAARGEPRYQGTCRALSAPARAARARGGAPAGWRVDAGGVTIALRDALAGEFVASVDDFVVWRGEDGPAYNLAVVVDDSDQGIGEVVRGDDLLETTPRQILLARLLALAVPRYAHVPLVLGPDGRRLAKRDGAVTLAQRLALGESVETVVGWLASSAGLIEPGRACSASELLAGFDVAKLSRAPAVFAQS